MPINVGYTPVSALGGAAILAGQGQYNRYLQELNQRWNLAQAEMQNRRDLQAAQISAEAQRQQASFGQQSSMADKEYSQRKEFAGIGHGYDLEKMDAQHGYRQDDMRADQQNDLAKIAQSFENQKALQALQYTGPDAFKVQKIQQQIKDLQSNPSFTDEEKAEGVKQLQTQLLGLHPETMPINLQDYFTKNSAQIEGLGTMIRTPDGKFHVIKPPSESSKVDKFNDPSFLSRLMRDVESDLSKSPKYDAGGSPSPEEIDAEFQRRLDSLKRAAGRGVSESSPSGPAEFNPDGVGWTPEMQRAGMENELAAGQAGVRDPQALVMARNTAARDVFQGGSTAQAQPSTPAADPIARSYPPEVAQQINSLAAEAKAELDAARKSGDKAAIAAAKAKAQSIIDRYMPQDSGAAAVAPPQAPIVPPPPVTSKPKSRTNSMTVKGRTISKER